MRKEIADKIIREEDWDAETIRKRCEKIRAQWSEERWEQESRVRLQRGRFLGIKLWLPEG